MRALQKIVVRSKFLQEGWHNWPEVPEELSYLRNSHRHIFHVEVGVVVTDKNREVEIITLGYIARDAFINLSILSLQDRNFGARSCEMLAAELGAKLIKKELAVEYVTVFEDGENGASVTFGEL